MSKVKIIRSTELKEFETAINYFISDENIQVKDIKYTTESIVNKYNAHGVPVQVLVYDTAYIYYEEDEDSVNSQILHSI